MNKYSSNWPAPYKYRGRELAYPQNIFHNELKEAPYGNLIKRKKTGKGTKPDVLTSGNISLIVPEHHDPFTQNGTSISASLITRLIVYIWENNPTLKSQALKKAFQGKAVNLSEYEFQWVGLSRFRLEKAGAIISSLINKSRRKNKNEI